MTTYSYDSAEIESEVKNLIIDIDQLALANHDVIFVPEDGIAEPFTLKLDDAVLSLTTPTTITFNFYPTDRSANSEAICSIPVSSEDIAGFKFPFIAEVTWLGKDTLGNPVPVGTYVYTINVSQPDGDNDSSESSSLKICDTFAGDSDDPDKMTMLYTMVDTVGHDATEAYVRVYDSLGVKVVDDTAGTKTCWSTEGATDGWNYSELPIPEATEDAYGAFRCVVRAKDAGAATEKAHRNKWAIGKNAMLGTYRQACYYICDLQYLEGAEECSNLVVNNSKSWLVGQGKWVERNPRNLWIRDYYASHKVGKNEDDTGTEGPYADKSKGTIKSVISTLGNIESDFGNLFHFYGHGNTSFITCGAGVQLTATELSELTTVERPYPLSNIRLAVLVSCKSVRGATSIGFKFKELGAQHVIGARCIIPNAFAKEWSKKFTSFAMKGEYLNAAHANVYDEDAEWHAVDLDLAMQRADSYAQENYEYKPGDELYSVVSFNAMVNAEGFAMDILQ